MTRFRLLLTASAAVLALFPWLRWTSPGETQASPSSLARRARAEGELSCPMPSSPGLEVSRSEAEWKEILTPAQFYVLRQKGIEMAFTDR